MPVTPYYQDALVTLYHGDCREILPTVPCVALVITDPPYGIRYQSNHRHVRHDELPNDDTLPLDVFPLCRVREGGAAYWFCREADIGAFNAVAFDAGWKPRRALVWDKGNWGSGDLEGDWGAQCETVAWAARGRHLLRGNRPSNLLRIARVGTDDHPTEKPEPLFARIIAVSSDAGDIVLDPFSGTGAALVASKRIGRQAIGIEIQERFCELTAKRLSQGTLAEMFQ